MVLIALLIIAGVIAAGAALPTWMENVVGGSAIQGALYRAMQVSGVSVLFRRPPAEARPALGDLIHQASNQAELYSLRALQDEQALDFEAAEADWKLYVQKAADPVAAQLSLADFYGRRLRPMDQLAALAAAAKAPAPSAEKLAAPAEQRSWKAFEQIFSVIKANALPREVSIAQYRAWIARYPGEKSLYGRYFEFLLAEKDFSTAQQLIADYARAFPGDQIFPVKARALLNYRQGSVEQGLAVYDQAFQPLWPAELVQSFFDLLKQTRRERQFLDRARAALAANPDDLSAMARVFYYYQQQGKPDVARQTINEYRLHKEERNASWSSEELYTLARLLDGIQAYPDAARYYFALYNSKGMNDAPERALAGLVNLLLTAPEQPIRLGSGELSMYSDIATMDTGPGFLNGILSLILNSTSPEQQFATEEQRAVPYFHRARAAELLALFDARFPKSERRAELHAKLIEVYSTYGESEAVIRSGREFLATFANAPQRTRVALLMADAFARTKNAQEEFAIYDALLQELAAKADGVPLGAKADNLSSYQAANPEPSAEAGDVSAEHEGEGESEGEGEEGPPSRAQQRQGAARRAFSIAAPASAATAQPGVRSPEYARVLERYISRLVAMKQVPQALTVLRRELDRNPNDPGLYERLAQFLDQNQLGTEQEQVYRRAIQQFPDRSWYHKLARWYLRNKREAEFEKLTREVTDIFAGTELQQYFNDMVSSGGPQLYLRLNQYAHQRFPHNLTFVRNLLGAYHTRPTYNQAAWEQVLRQHWFEADDLRNQFFEHLSSTGKLNAELQAVRNTPAAQKGQWQEIAKENPAAANFAAEATMWQSHFEESAPALGVLARLYPADVTLGRKASAVYRSLVYFDPRNTESAIAIEQNLLKYEPGNRETLARIGDIYADRELFARAAPFWKQMAEVRPGEARGYLDSATVFWDYFEFDEALGLLEQGRKKLGDANLYSYEAGAIHENQHDYPRAVEEYVKGALGGDSRAEQRLLELARRPAVRPSIEEATAKLTEPADPPMAAIRLRMAVLEAQNRKADLEKLLSSIVDRSKSFDVLEDLETIAQQKSLESVRQHALERQATITTDPVRRLELRYALVRFYEGRKDFEAARRNVDALYQENPKILGVVRATVDFYWRTKMQPRAIEVLLQAAGNSYPDLKKQFSFEAARKATEVGEYQRARSLLEPLLQASPYDSSYLAAMADTYARAGDDRGLRDFYVAKMQMLRNAPLPQAERTERIAAMRRGLIPALTRLKDYAGAVDQYIEIINKYPEDEGLNTEAALYAQRYARQEQLLAFYNKTVADSPRDYRWAMVLARLQTNLENYPAAIEAYSKSITIRPDRVDLRTSRAALEERLMRFDDAIGDYEKLYDLTYHDSKWMEKVAEIRARQGKAPEAVQALKTALIEGRPENANNYFEVARRLESWGFLPQAREFAEQGVNTAGDNLLAVADHHSGAQIYVRVLTRLRKQDVAYNRLNGAVQAASAQPSSVKAIAQQVEKQGIAAVTDEEWRKRQQEMRRTTARSGMRTALKEMGETAARYFTPEEKSAFAGFVESKRAGMDVDSVAELLLPWSEAAGLAELEARWRYELLMANSNKYGGQLQALLELQRRRLKFNELGTQLETYANTLSREHRYVAIQRAAEAYRLGGNVPGELRTLTTLGSLSALGGDAEQRYYELLLAHQPQLLVTLAGQGPRDVPDKVANFAVANGDSKLALATVAARSRNLPAVWNKAYTGLVGLYFRETGPEIDSAFLGALGNATIGERLGKRVDRNQQLAGDIWFYYGSRYGEYRSVAHAGDPEDYLPAMLERSPNVSAGYFSLAEFYAESGDSAKALADYEHTLELDSNRGDVRDRMAVIFWKDGKRAEALAQWKQVLAILDKQLNSRRVPESFWTNFSSSVGHLGERNLMGEFRPEIDALLRTYVRRNGTWRSLPLLRAAYRAIKDPAAGTAWLLDLCSVAPGPQSLISSLANAAWIPQAQREPFYRRLLELGQEKVARSEGLARDYAQQEVFQLQLRWINYLVKTRQFQRAQEALDSLPKETQSSGAASLVPVQLRVAAELGALDRMLETYRSDPEHAPALESLRSAAKMLQDAGDKAAARKILELVFARELEQHRLSAANFLGLAEIRLDTGDTAGAVELLRRMTLVAAAPFENLDSAAALLVKCGHPAEALEFLEPLVKAVPWNAPYRVRLAQAQIQAARNVEAARDTLVTIAASADVPYEIRTQAASALAGSRPQSDLHSAELKLLASTMPIAPAEADRPYFYPARLKAAEKAGSPDAQVKLLRGALEFWPKRDPARLALFKSAVGGGKYQLSLAAIDPLLQTGLLSSYPSGEPEQEAPDEYDDYRMRAAVERIPAAERASIASSAALSLEKTGRPDQAVRYLQTALRLESSAARRKELNSRLAELNAALRRKSQNAARQPMIHEALEQNRMVRPRLVARAAPTPAKPATKPANRGGKKT